METTPPDEGESLSSLDAQLGQLSATWDPIAAPPAQNTTRRGKWTAPECDYAAVVIEHFANGRLPGLSGGESLRATLAELLGCAPMRITKKLSSTRAHGKQCFKKRGELSARERVALESARAAFLRSLDAGFVHGPLGPSVKKPRGLAPDDPWLESLQGSSWVDEDLDKRDRSWLDLGSANQAPLEPSVTLKASGRGTNLCRVVALDRPGLLGDISDVFNRRGLNVVKCRAESFGNGVCRDEFELVAVATNRALEDTDALQQAVYDCVTEELEPCTTLRVAAPDRPGLLKDIAASFENLKLSVVGARVAMVQDDDAVTAETRFEVVDRDDAQPIVDPDRLASIENMLARDLDGAAAAGAPAPYAPDVLPPAPWLDARPLARRPALLSTAGSVETAAVARAGAFRANLLRPQPAPGPAPTAARTCSTRRRPRSATSRRPRPRRRGRRRTSATVPRDAGRPRAPRLHIPAALARHSWAGPLGRPGTGETRVPRSRPRAPPTRPRAAAVCGDAAPASAAGAPVAASPVWPKRRFASRSAALRWRRRFCCDCAARRRTPQYHKARCGSPSSAASSFFVAFAAAAAGPRGEPAPA